MLSLSSASALADGYRAKKHCDRCLQSLRITLCQGEPNPKVRCVSKGVRCPLRRINQGSVLPKLSRRVLPSCIWYITHGPIHPFRLVGCGTTKSEKRLCLHWISPSLGKRVDSA